MDKNEIHKNLSHTSVELTYKFWNLSRSVITKKETDIEWCPLEILVHMRQEAEIYTARVKRMIKTEDGAVLPFLHDFDEYKMMAKIDLEEETPKANLRLFMQARSAMLNNISMDDSVWESKKAIHEIEGEVTLRELLIPLVLREKKYLDRLNELLPE